MATHKQTPMQPQITYKREKGKMEISGDADKIKVHIWFDQISSFLIGAVPTIILLLLPKASWFVILKRWLKNLMALAPFLIATGYLMMQLSG